MRDLINIINEADRAFEQWFGQSKVVDADGAPLLVYHGTNQTFDAFSKDRGGMSTGPMGGADDGFFFTDNEEEAWEYAHSAGRRVIANIDKHEAETERLRLAQERLERIAQRTSRQSDWEAFEQAYAAWEAFEIDATREDETTGVNVISAYLALQNPLVVNFNGTLESEEGVIEDVVNAAVARGHDGVIMRNINDSPVSGGFHSNHYVAFSNEQVRRA